MDDGRGPRRWWWQAPVSLMALSLGCVIEAPNDEGPGACGEVQCSIDGHCRGGECLCDRGFLGDPYALHGCQSTMPGTGCDTTCGLNAYCEAGTCVCADGHIAVCGSGDCLALRHLCDGIPDCANSNDEAPQTCAEQVVQPWTLVDECDDGIDVSWRLWSRDRDWAWPNASEVFVTDGWGRGSHEEIECLKGELMCLGAQAGELSWGVGVDGTGQCEDCCFYCREEGVDFGPLTCE